MSGEKTFRSARKWAKITRLDNQRRYFIHVGYADETESYYFRSYSFDDFKNWSYAIDQAKRMIEDD